jgi:hypothetical protein
VLRSVTTNLITEEALLGKLSANHLYSARNVPDRDKRYEMQVAEAKCIIASERFAVHEERMEPIIEMAAATTDADEAKSAAAAAGAGAGGGGSRGDSRAIH